jgi:hypothetical protein
MDREQFIFFHEMERCGVLMKIIQGVRQTVCQMINILIDGPTDSGSPGSAYVLKYDPDAMSWREERELYGYSDNDDLFGSSVAISGDGTALVGAPGDESIYGSGDEQISIKSGSASVFIEFGGPAPWTFLANLFPSDPIADGLFGQSVAISRDRSIDSM